MRPNPLRAQPGALGLRNAHQQPDWGRGGLAAGRSGGYTTADNLAGRAWAVKSDAGGRSCPRSARRRWRV